jgi:hypothetical protein
MKYRVVAAFGGECLTEPKTLEDTVLAAVRLSSSQIVHVWSTSGGHFGMGKVVAHFANGICTWRELR